MQRLRAPVPTVTIGNCADPDDVVCALALDEFYTGRHQWARTRRVEHVSPEATLLPAGVAPVRTVRTRHYRTLLALSEGWTLRVTRWPDGTAQLTVTAVDEATGEKVLVAALAGAIEAPEVDDDVASVGFWFFTGRGPDRRTRRIDVPTWETIRHNYAAAAAAQLDSLMGFVPESLRGRLLLLHGPPGTGKTTALRALAHAWRAWCQFDYVLDPERLFDEPGYLMSVVLGDEDDRDPSWRLLVLEDCDELIRIDAKRATGQALSRLLNLTDGLLGQGLELLVALTTNERLGSLHPAITRAGRCVAEVEVGPLSSSEASTWLGRPAAVRSGGITLAELYAQRSAITKLTHRNEPAVGGYL
jgi:hypothetical protein